MKYIRTKDGRIIDTATLPPLVKEMKYDGEGIGEYHGSPIVAEADTIEELCDCFVLRIFPNEPKYRGWRIFNKPIEEKEDLIYIRDLIGWYGRHSEVVCGAIEMDKGLIYVAKVNKKGKLELL